MIAARGWAAGCDRPAGPARNAVAAECDLGGNPSIRGSDARYAARMDQDRPATDARELFTALRDSGPDAYAAVIEPWLARTAGGYRDELARSAAGLCHATSDESAAQARQAGLWELYALGRVSDVLLLAFQPPWQHGPAEPWAHKLHPLDHWPALPIEQYLRLFTDLGMASFDDTGMFDPFLHEIVDVEQAADPDEPIRITGLVWPGLRLGPLLFSRAGVRIRAGAHHAERGVADRSPLYWAFLRRHRPTVDLSHGWGHNSQWRTDFRLDHRTPTTEHLNADGHLDLGNEQDLDPDSALLTPAERRELLQHRCLLRTPTHASTLATTSAHWPTELFPFDWRQPASRTTAPPALDRENHAAAE
jgi:hypothetical protein